MTSPRDPHKPQINIPVPDLGEIRARKQAEAQRAANTIMIEELPNSCLYEIFMQESIAASNRSIGLMSSIASGELANAARAKGSDIGTEIQNAMLGIEINVNLATARATLALAAATAAHNDVERPTWYDDNGQLSAFALDYFERRKQASPTALHTVE